MCLVSFMMILGKIMVKSPLLDLMHVLLVEWVHLFGFDLLNLHSDVMTFSDSECFLFN